MNFLTGIPALTRKRIYQVYAFVGVVLGAIQVAYATIDGAAVPDWLKVALVVYAYLGTALGVTASVNVNRLDTPKPAPKNPPAPA